MTRIRFEDLPSTNTPRNAENLNKLNNVVISSTEPTTGEEVWFQKGKNLSEINSISEVNGEQNIYLVKINNILSDSDITISMTKTRISGVTVGNPALYDFGVVIFYDSDNTYISQTNGDVYTLNSGSLDMSKTITIPSNCTNIIIDFSNNNGDINKNINISNIQVEYGSSKTSYEPYIDKKIYVKNDNGVYEEFYDKSEMNKETYSTTEQVIGTWTDGKPLYRKVIDYLPSSDINSNNTTTTIEIPHNILNLELVTDVKCTTSTNHIIPHIYGNQSGNFHYSTSINQVTNTNIIMVVINDTWSRRHFYFTLEYTKTTD